MVHDARGCVMRKNRSYSRHLVLWMYHGGDVNKKPTMVGISAANDNYLYPGDKENERQLRKFKQRMPKVCRLLPTINVCSLSQPAYRPVPILNEMVNGRPIMDRIMNYVLDQSPDDYES